MDDRQKSDEKLSYYKVLLIKELLLCYLIEKNKQAETFPKEKLSQQALDNFAKRYIHPKGIITYTLQSGEQIKVSAIDPIESKHFEYLLGQIAPYHIPEQKSFPLKYAAYILDENKKLVPWCTDPKVLSQFVTFGQAFGLIALEKDSTGKITFGRNPDTKPVTHTDD